MSENFGCRYNSLCLFHSSHSQQSVGTTMRGQCLRDSADTFVYYVRQLSTHSRTAGSARCSVNGHELTQVGTRRKLSWQAQNEQYSDNSSWQCELFIHLSKYRQFQLDLSRSLWWKHHTWYTDKENRFTRDHSARRLTRELRECLSGPSGDGRAGTGATPAHRSRAAPPPVLTDDASFPHFTSLTRYYEFAFKETPNSIPWLR